MKRFAKIVEKNDRQYLMYVSFDIDEDVRKMHVMTRTDEGFESEMKMSINDGVDIEKGIFDDPEEIDYLIKMVPINLGGSDG